jgi:hypothetical protein
VAAGAAQKRHVSAFADVTEHRHIAVAAGGYIKAHFSSDWCCIKKSYFSV